MGEKFYPIAPINHNPFECDTFVKCPHCGHEHMLTEARMTCWRCDTTFVLRIEVE